MKLLHKATALTFASAITASSLLLPAHANNIKVEPGLYKISGTMSMTMPGMPDGMMPPQSLDQEQCMTGEDANLTPEQVTKNLSNNGECTTDSIDSSSSEMRVEFTCKMAEMGEMSGTLEMTGYGGEYQSKAVMTSPEGFAMNVQMTGKRIGDC